MAQRAAADLRLPALRGDDIDGFHAGERVGGVRGQRLGIAPAGVAAILRSLRSVSGESHGSLRKPDVPARSCAKNWLYLRGGATHARVWAGVANVRRGRADGGQHL